MSAELWTFLEQFNVVTGDLTFLLAVGGFIYREKIRHWISRNHFPNQVGHPLDNAIQWDAIVFTVSNAVVPEWVIERFKPGYIGLVATPESVTAATQIAEFAKTRHIVPIIKIIDNPDDPAQSRSATESLITDLRQAKVKAIAVDLTGGKVTMSLGAFMAAEELGAYSLYVSTQFDKELKKPDMNTAKILCVSKPQ